MRKLTHNQREQAVNCLIEGCSIRATVRMTGIAKKTVMRLLVAAGVTDKLWSVADLVGLWEAEEKATR